jgi:hypothetical protein
MAFPCLEHPVLGLFALSRLVSAEIEMRLEKPTNLDEQNIEHFLNEADRSTAHILLLQSDTQLYTDVTIEIIELINRFRQRQSLTPNRAVPSRVSAIIGSRLASRLGINTRSAYPTTNRVGFQQISGNLPIHFIVQNHAELIDPQLAKYEKVIADWYSKKYPADDADFKSVPFRRPYYRMRRAFENDEAVLASSHCFNEERLLQHVFRVFLGCSYLSNMQAHVDEGGRLWAMDQYDWFEFQETNRDIELLSKLAQISENIESHCHKVSSLTEGAIREAFSHVPASYWEFGGVFKDHAAAQTYFIERLRLWKIKFTNPTKSQ